MPGTSVLRRIGVFCVVASLCLSGGASLAGEQPGGRAAEQEITTPILALWRDPGSFFVVQTGYGNFYYTYDAAVPTADGRGWVVLSDPGGKLLQAILTSADGRPVRLRISRQSQPVVIGIGDVACSLRPVAAPEDAASESRP